jgi:hypothetical protein
MTRDFYPPMVWDCDICQLPVQDGDGFLTVDRVAVHRIEVARMDVNGPRATNHPPWDTDADRFWMTEAPWQVFHGGCDPTVNYLSYWFDVAIIRTTAELLDWRRHLQRKRWFDVTNWDEFIRFRVDSQPSFELCGRTRPKDRPTVARGDVVYRHFTAEDILLYVGYSSDCDARQRQHANSSDWWPESARMDIERFSDRSTALRAELAAIRAEHPLWNIQHNPR